MSAAVDEHTSPTTGTTSGTRSRTTTEFSTPMSSASSSSLTLTELPPVSSSLPLSSSSSMSLSEVSTSVPTPTVPTTTAVIPTTTTSITVTPTTTTSITITPTTTLTTTTTNPIPIIPPSSTTIPPTTTTTSTVIPPASPLPPTSSTTPHSSTVPRPTSTTVIATTPTPASLSTIPLVSTPPTGPVPSPEAMMSSRTAEIVPISTFSTTVFVSTTDVRGSITVYAPPFITTTATFMAPGGTPTTSTAVIANPTLNIDNSSPSSFFQNKGAVAGVFTLVGLAVISITLWAIFFIQRRRRAIRIERETAVSASLAAAGFNRTPFEDEYDSSSSQREFMAIPMPNPNPDRHRRSTSSLLRNQNGRLSILPDAYHEDRGRYDPYIEYAMRNSRDSYHDIPSPITPHLNVPPPSAFNPYSDRMGMVEAGNGLPITAGIPHRRHSHQSSGGSLEPLLSHHRRNGPSMSGYGPLVRNNLSNGRASRTSSKENGSAASTVKPLHLQPQQNFHTTNAFGPSVLMANGREGSDVDSNGTQKRDGDGFADAEASTAEDEFEMQKPVLAVCNLPDAASTLSLS